MRFAIVQTKLIDDLDERYKRSLELLRCALEWEADFVMFPEMWLTGFTADIKALRLAQGFLEEVLRLSEERRVAVLCGTLPEKGERGFYNACFGVLSGKVFFKRRKRVLFEPMKEDKLFLPGDFPGIYKALGARFSVLICYELRFPEIARKVALEGLDFIYVPAQWPSARLEHWLALLKARAVENQCFVFGVNVVGNSKGILFSGGSAIFHPLGKPVLSVRETEGVFIVDVDLNEESVKNYRESIPVFRDGVKYGVVEWGFGRG